MQEAWSGGDLLAWGVEHARGASADGVAYDPKANGRSPAPSPEKARRTFPQVWTGTDMLVWGGGSRTAAFPLGTGPGYERATNAWCEVRPSLGGFIADVEWTRVGMLVWGRSIPAGHRGTIQIADDGVGHERFSDVHPVLPR